MPGNWLNDEVINKYRELIRSETSVILTTFAFGIIKEGNANKMKRILKKSLPKSRSLGDHHYLLVPINRSHNHWFLIAIDLQLNLIIVVDSIRNKLNTYVDEIKAIQYLIMVVLGLKEAWPAEVCKSNP